MFQMFENIIEQSYMSFQTQVIVILESGCIPLFPHSVDMCLVLNTGIFINEVFEELLIMWEFGI